MIENGSNDIVLTAQRLYKLGLNVFPVPSPREVLAWAADPSYGAKEKKPRDSNSKPPYLIHVIFNNRLHVCDETCAAITRKTRRGCLAENETFENLFFDPRTGYVANLAVMLGKTSGNLMVIDCDSQDAFKRNLEIVQQKNIPHWAYASFRGGGILVRILEGEVDNKKKCLETDVEIYGNHHYAVLPPSLHPQSIYYSWLNINPIADDNITPLKPVSIRELNWLGISLLYERPSIDSAIKTNATKLDLTGYPTWLSKLSKANQEFVINGTKLSRRNSSLFAAACDMAGNQIEYQAAESLLLDACSKCNPPYPYDEAVRSIHSAYSTPREPAQLRQNNSDQSQIAIEFLKKFNWKLMGGTWKSDMAVFIATIERARAENQVFRCTIREITELSNRSIATVINSLNRLACIDNEDSIGGVPSLLVLDHHDDSNNAAYYRFSDSVINWTELEQYLTLDNSVLNVYIPNPSTDAEKDVEKKIGTLGWKIWKYLLENPRKTRAEIAVALNLHRHSVRRQLHENKTLVLYDFVTFDKTTGDYFGNSFTQEILGHLADTFETSGKSQKVRLGFQRDREIRANQMIGLVREYWLRRRWSWECEQSNDSSERYLMSLRNRIDPERLLDWSHPYLADTIFPAKPAIKKRNKKINFPKKSTGPSTGQSTLNYVK